MLKSHSKEIASQFWAAELGAESFQPGTVIVQEHCPSRIGSLGNRIFCLSTNSALFITAPAETVAEIRHTLAQTTDSHFDALIKLFQGRSRIVGDGPAYIGYRDVSGMSTEEIACIPVQDDRVQALKIAQPDDWDVFGYSPQSRGLFAVQDKDKVLGLSHYEVWGEAIAHIGVIVNQQARSQGIGRLVVEAAMNAAISEGFLPQYRTLWSNIPSMKLADKMGFKHFGDSLVIRFGEQ